MYLSVAVLSGTVICAASQARVSVPDATIDALALERGTDQARLNALVSILRITPERRGAPVVAAIEREARRMLKVYRDGRYNSEAERQTSSDYAAGLVLALGQSRRPEDIPLLVEFSGFGTMGTDAVAGYGESAVPALVKRARGGRGDLEQRAGAIFSLAEISRRAFAGTSPALSMASQAEIGALATELLERQLTFVDVVVITELALATHRPELRTELERLANNLDPWTMRGLVDAERITQSQHLIQVMMMRSP